MFLPYFTTPTRDQIDLAVRIRDEWSEIAHLTTPAAREEAEEGVRLVYEAAGLAHPRIRWVVSPRAGFKIWNAEGWGLEYRLRGNLGTTDDGPSLRLLIEDVLEAQVSPDFLDWAADTIGDPVASEFKRLVEVPIEAASRRFVTPRLWRSARSHWIPVLRWSTIGGPSVGMALEPSQGWVARAEFWRDIGVVKSPYLVSVIEGYSKIKRSAGWWWPGDDQVLLMERPSVLRLDKGGCLHSARGRAIEYRGGWGLEVVHGECAH